MDLTAKTVYLEWTMVNVFATTKYISLQIDKSWKRHNIFITDSEEQRWNYWIYKNTTRLCISFGNVKRNPANQYHRHDKQKTQHLISTKSTQCLKHIPNTCVQNNWFQWSQQHHQNHHHHKMKVHQVGNLRPSGRSSIWEHSYYYVIQKVFKGLFNFTV